LPDPVPQPFKGIGTQYFSSPIQCVKRIGSDPPKKSNKRKEEYTC
jgi:hypothetical protein